jgi:murein DD-endopeptidase MepM/ murein hydrolase activator NlpD
MAKGYYSAVKEVMNRGGIVAFCAVSEYDDDFFINVVKPYVALLQKENSNHSVLFLDGTTAPAVGTQDSPGSEGAGAIWNTRYMHTPLQGDSLRKSHDERATLTSIVRHMSTGVDYLRFLAMPAPTYDQWSTFLYNLGVSRDFFHTVIVLVPQVPWLDQLHSNVLLSVILGTPDTLASWYAAHKAIVQKTNDREQLCFSFWQIPQNVSGIGVNAQKTAEKKTTWQPVATIGNIGSINIGKCPNCVVQPRIAGTSNTPRAQGAKGKVFLMGQGVDSTQNAEVLRENIRTSIMRRNPPGLLLQFARASGFWIFLVLLLVVALRPISLTRDTSFFKGWGAEYHKLQYNSYMDYRFEPGVTLQRVAKAAIHRYAAVVPDTQQVHEYIYETLQKNGKEGKTIRSQLRLPEAFYPVKGTRLKWYPPDKLSGAHFDSLAPVYHYFWSLTSDTLAYITDHFNDEPGPGERVHKGIDLGAREGYFLLAPFDGVCYIAESKWGGNMVAVANEYSVFIYAHLNNYLVLQGQSVKKGDALGSVGMTGRTTGPHAHIGVGYLNKKGKNSFSGLRFDLVNPFEWFYKGAEQYAAGDIWVHPKMSLRKSPGTILGLEQVKPSMEPITPSPKDTSLSKPSKKQRLQGVKVRTSADSNAPELRKKKGGLAESLKKGTQRPAKGGAK